MSKIHPLIKFLAVLIISLGLVFFAHSAILHNKGLPPYGDMLVTSYTVNFILATAIYIALFVFRKRLKNQIGFLFMSGSLLKFIFFFLLFYPVYKEDGEMSRLEFAAFFIPYAICLVTETFFVAKMLRNLK